MHAGKRPGQHKGSAREDVFNTFSYEESAVFLASRQKEEEKNSYPARYIPHLTKVLSRKPEGRGGGK